MATLHENQQYQQDAMALKEAHATSVTQLFSFSFVKNGKDSKSRKRQFYVVTLSQFQQIVLMLKPTFIQKFATPV